MLRNVLTYPHKDESMRIIHVNAANPQNARYDASDNIKYHATSDHRQNVRYMQIVDANEKPLRKIEGDELGPSRFEGFDDVQGVAKQTYYHKQHREALGNVICFEPADGQCQIIPHLPGQREGDDELEEAKARRMLGCCIAKDCKDTDVEQIHEKFEGCHLFRFLCPP